MRRLILFTLGLLILLTTPLRAAEEIALVKLWQTHMAAQNQHTGVIAACRRFEQEHPADSLRLVAIHLRAWHLLKVGQQEEARALLIPMVGAGATGVEKAASDLARAWLTRLDRDAVKSALQQVYRRTVAFPEKLNVWTASDPTAPPLTDRWGKPWSYRLIGYDRMPGLRDQKYELQSVLLGDTSDLDTALARPYADRIILQPLALKRMSNSSLVQFAVGTTGEKAMVAEGSRYDRILFAFTGRRIILLADYTHWKVLPKPQ